jgi:hypothetical protein
MRRFSISKAMAVIALLAANFAGLRAILTSTHYPDQVSFLLSGLLPLVDAQIIGLYLMAMRYRISLRRRIGKTRGGGVPAFTAFSAWVFLILLPTCILVPSEVTLYVGTVLEPIVLLFHSLGFQSQDFEGPFFQFVVAPFLLGAVLSGPPLVLALTFGWLSRGYELVIAPRPDSRTPPTRSHGDSAETQS